MQGQQEIYFYLSETLDYIIIGAAKKCKKRKKNPNKNRKNELISVISCPILTHAIYMTILGASLPYNLLGQPEIKTCAIVAIYKVDC